MNEKKALFSINGQEILPLKLDYKTIDENENYRGYVRGTLKYIKEHLPFYGRVFKNIVESHFTSTGKRPYEGEGIGLVIGLNYSENDLKKNLIRVIKKLNENKNLILEFTWNGEKIKETKVDELIKLLEDKDRRLRIAAAESLKGTKYEDRAINKLVELLEDKNPLRRKEAAESLKGTKYEDKAINKLIELLENKNPRIRKEAAESLKETKSEDKAIEKLVELLEDKNPQVRITAAKVLKDIDNKEIQQKIKKIIDKGTEKKINNIIEEIENKQIIDKEQIYNILMSLKVSNFLIFAGPSGVGKTLLAQNIAKSLGGEFKKIPVKSNFTDETSILGYRNPLLGRYEGTEYLKFLIESYQNQLQPYFLLLDEMNLSKIENYFSIFLSEIDKLKDSDNEKLDNEEPKILLFETSITNKRQFVNIKNFLENYFGDNYEEYVEFKGNGTFLDYDEKETDENGNFKTEDIANIKVFLKLSKNLHVIGTINEDETTYSVSNKVLDRSQFIVFEIPNLFGDEDTEKFDKFDKLIEKNYFDDFYDTKLKIKDYFSEGEKSKLSKIKFLNKINKKIQQISLNESIGYRTVKEMLTYIKNYCYYEEGKEEINELILFRAIDNQICQKVLPKLKTFNLMLDEKQKAFEELGDTLYDELKKISKIDDNKDLKSISKSIKFYEYLKSNLIK